MQCSPLDDIYQLLGIGARAWPGLVVLALVLAGPFALQAATPHRDPRMTAELVSQVRAQGQVQVIVELSLPQSPRSERYEAIARVRQRLLNTLALFDVEVIREYQSLPLLTLRVGPVALGYLLASEQVANVSADQIMSTQPHGTGGSVLPPSNTPK